MSYVKQHNKQRQNLIKTAIQLTADNAVQRRGNKLMLTDEVV